MLPRGRASGRRRRRADAGEEEHVEEGRRIGAARLGGSEKGVSVPAAEAAERPEACQRRRQGRRFLFGRGGRRATAGSGDDEGLLERLACKHRWRHVEEAGGRIDNCRRFLVKHRVHCSTLRKGDRGGGGGGRFAARSGGRRFTQPGVCVGQAVVS